VITVPSLPTVLVAMGPDGTFSVRTRHGKTETSHLVAVPSGFDEELGVSGVSGEELVRASFVFLLDREPATSILGKFSLDLISRYFPEYRTEIHKYLEARPA
jgi:hypothetical protein